MGNTSVEIHPLFDDPGDCSTGHMYGCGSCYLSIDEDNNLICEEYHAEKLLDKSNPIVGRIKNKENIVLNDKWLKDRFLNRRLVRTIEIQVKKMWIASYTTWTNEVKKNGKNRC